MRGHAHYFRLRASSLPELAKRNPKYQSKMVDQIRRTDFCNIVRVQDQLLLHIHSENEKALSPVVVQSTGERNLAQPASILRRKYLLYFVMVPYNFCRDQSFWRR